MNNFKMNKKAMSISIVLLVALTLVLVIITLFYFVINEKGKSSILNIPTQIDSVYSDSDYFDFYFNNAFQKAADGIRPEEGADVFIQKLKDELNKTLFFPAAGSYIEYNHINESSVEISNNIIALNLDVDVINNKSLGSGELGIRYSYTKRFEKKF